MSAVPQQPATVAAAQPRPTLGVFDACMMIVGIVIGVGIFRAPAVVASNVPDALSYLLLWVAGGIISLIGALCYAELASTYPGAGGEYNFLRRAFGDSISFLFAWARMTVIQTGAIALVAFVFGDYASQIVGLGPAGAAIYAAAAIIVLTGLNVIGTAQGKLLQNVLTLALVVALAVTIITGLAFAPAAPQPASLQPASYSGLAMILILVTYGGWNEAAYLTAELRDARRNIVRALVIGISVITACYLLINLAYVNALGLSGLRESKAVAADLVRLTMGDAGAVVLSLLVMAAALSTLNATIFTGARTNYAFGRDFPLFSLLGHWNQSNQTPVNALLVQGAIALVLVVVGSMTRDGFSTMVDYTAPAFWFFFLLVGLSLFVFRRWEPEHERSFNVPFYPVTPLVFCATCVYMLHSSLDYVRLGALLSVGVLLLGVPVLLWARKSADVGRG